MHSADNLFMITSHSGIDPRMSLVGGYDVGAYAFPIKCERSRLALTWIYNN